MKFEDAVISSLDTEEERQFRTFSNYILAIGLLLKKEYAISSALVASMRSRLKSKTPPLPVDEEKIASCLKRAWATEYLMNVPFHLAEMKEIVPPSILWLPVQIYYTVYSALEAALLSHGHNSERHSKALNCFSEQLRSKMPHPLNYSCKGAEPDLVYESFTHQPSKEYSTLRRPDTLEDANHLVGTALRSTRRSLVEDKCNDWKRRNKKKRISAAERTKIASDETPTTILHFLYRLRLRSNYGDTELFVSGPTRYESVEFAKAYVSVADYWLGALEVLVEKRLGNAFLKTNVEEFSKRFSSKAPPVKVRWAVH